MIKNFSSPKIQNMVRADPLRRSFSEANQNSLTFPKWCPWKESNPHHWVRSPVLYPLSYRGELLFVNFACTDIYENNFTIVI